MKNRRQYNLFHYRWIIPVIGVLYDQNGAKFITLLNELKISRSVLSSTLRKLIEQGFVMRNPGYGHPLRPEYILTGKGIRLGPFCTEMMTCIIAQKGSHLFQSRWAIQIINLCSQGEIRFSELKSALTPITSRALSEELKLLNSEGFIERKIIEGYPPLTTYSLAMKSIPFIKVIDRHKNVLIPFL
jgi:DNA-binding HxlR family transcriptional regulator